MKRHLIHNLTIPVRGGKGKKNLTHNIKLILKERKMLFIGWLMLPKSEQAVRH